VTFSKSSRNDGAIVTYVFPDFDAVIAIHRDQINRYGGAHGLRDEGLLRSALATAQATFAGQWLHEFPHGMAAALAFHITANHPFLDGNKRAGLATALTFLSLNEYRLGAKHADVEALVLAIARGEKTKDEVIQVFQNYTRPKS
jgi:death on curing protein